MVPGISVIAPVGVSFFLLASLGYSIDIYWERYIPEKNYLHLLLFLCFFPSLIQGPINRYDKLKKAIFVQHSFSYIQISNGIQRFIWGLFKKLILVDRLTTITNDIFGNLENHSGSIIIFGSCCFAIQLYADFSGYMDMVLGISQTFGITLSENFKRPYFSKTIGEFWRRWHITLGTWFKDYVMYGFIMSPLGRKIGKSVKKKNKHLGKLILPLSGTLIVWMLTGLWHGTSTGYILWGTYYGIIMCISLCLEDFWKKKRIQFGFCRTHIYSALCILRTCSLVLIADILICAESWGHIKLCIKKILFHWEIFDFKSIIDYISTIPHENIILILYGISVLLCVSLYTEKKEDIRHFLSQRPAIFQWIVWYVLIVSIIMFGTYGVGYDTTTFMYQSF